MTSKGSRGKPSNGEKDLEVLKSGNFSDATLKCGSSEWKIHKVTVIPRCEFFEKALTGPFNEAKTGVIVLSEENDTEAVDCAVHWIYAKSLKLDPRFVHETNKGFFALVLRTYGVADFLLLHEMKEELIQLMTKHLYIKVARFQRQKCARAGAYRREGHFSVTEAEAATMTHAGGMVEGTGKLPPGWKTERGQFFRGDHQFSIYARRVDPREDLENVDLFAELVDAVALVYDSNALAPLRKHFVNFIRATHWDAIGDPGLVRVMDAAPGFAADVLHEFAADAKNNIPTVGRLYYGGFTCKRGCHFGPLRMTDDQFIASATCNARGVTITRCNYHADVVKI